jgi:hypothetical protein
VVGTNKYEQNFLTEYFMSDEVDGIENATHNTHGKQTRIWTRKISRFAIQMKPNVLGIEFSNPSGLLLLVK